MALKAAQCPSCGASITVPDDRDRANCMYCGSSLSVKEAMSAVGGPDTKNILRIAFQFIEVRNTEEASAEITRVLELEPNNSSAWLCKALVSAMPKIQIAALGDSVLSQISPAIAETQKYASLALNGNIDDETFRRSAAKLFLGIAQDRIRGSGTSRVGDTALGWVGLARKRPPGNAMGCQGNASGLLRLAITCLKTSFQLDPSKEFVGAFQAMKPDIVKVLAEPTDSATDVEGLTNFETEIKNRYPDYIVSIQKDWLAVVMGAMLEDVDSARKGIDSLEHQQKSRQGCFVATATLGDADHPTVVSLRQFRDTWLLKRGWGRVLVGYYYVFGPWASELVKRSRSLRFLSRVMIIRPCEGIAEFLMKGK